MNSYIGDPFSEHQPLQDLAAASTQPFWSVHPAHSSNLNLQKLCGESALFDVVINLSLNLKSLNLMSYDLDLAST